MLASVGNEQVASRYALMKTINKVSLVILMLAFALASVGILNAKEPFFDGLGLYKRKVTTNSRQAQRYFNQGLAFYHGFNDGEAIRSFQAAAQSDPKCAMAHWGIALACGPNINLPVVPPPAAELAWKEIKLAQENAEHASPVERDLIEALSHRYANPPPEDRAPLDQAYADAMRKVWQTYPDDQDVGVLFAEAMMDLRPWNQWTPEGQANPGTDEILATLEAVLKLNPNHPFANHLYIHAVEASPHPERANSAADRLRTLQPGIAHMVHMPSHIDIRCGRWQEAVETNMKAVEADRRYRRIVGPPVGFINVYVAHNRHMLAYAAMMTGQRDLAMKHIRAAVAGLPADFLKENALQAEGFVAMPMEVMVRFGMWDKILAEPDNYADYMAGTRAFHHAARAIAYAAKGDPENARKEQAIFLGQVKLVPKEETFGNNTELDLLAVAQHMTEGEILIRENKLDAGIAELREAIKLEDTLHYDEPPGWLIPVRHSLGATLMRNSRYAEAEQVYREDLKKLPDNGWSLYGLAQSLRAQKKSPKEAKATEAKFKEIWVDADLKITSSCLCQPAKIVSDE
jgi:tetratricopeptide (TPR) repeat protein